MSLLQRLGAGAVLAALAASPAAHADPLPPDVAAILDAAAARGDPALLRQVADLARQTNPKSVLEIDARVAKLSATPAPPPIPDRRRGFLKGFTGEAQVGLNASTGESTTTGVVAGVKLQRETTRWVTKLRADIEYERDNGSISEENYYGRIEQAYKVTPRFYIDGLISAQRDPFAGFYGRANVALNAGYWILDRPRLKLAFETGPGMRYTNYVESDGVPSYRQTDGTWRVAGNFSWQISDTFKLSEEFWSMLSGENDTLSSTLALTSRIHGALAARASFLVTYESTPPVGIVSLDTTTKLTLVYGF